MVLQKMSLVLFSKTSKLTQSSLTLTEQDAARLGPLWGNAAKHAHSREQSAAGSQVSHGCFVQNRLGPAQRKTAQADQWCHDPRKRS